MTENYPKVVTPKGTAIWPKLNTPDTKYNAAGKYETKLAFEADTDISALRDKVEALIDAKYEEQVAEIRDTLTKQGKKGLIEKAIAQVSKVSPFKPEEDDQTGDETGRVIIKVGMTASGVSKKTGKPWNREPNVFDAKGNLLKNPPVIGSGSVLKANVELYPYFAANDKTVGVSFRLEAVQVIKLVQFGTRDAAGYGFGEEEGDDLSNCEAEFGAGSDDAGDAGDDEL